MKPVPWWLILVGFAAGAGLAYAYRGQKTAKALGEADAYHLQLQAAQDSLRGSRALQLVADSSSRAVTADAQARIVAADRGRARAEGRARDAEARQGAIVAGIGARAGADSAVALRAAQEATDSMQANVVAPLRAALTEATRASLAKDAELSAKDQQITTRDRVQGDLERALAASEAETKALRGALPGWLGRNWAKAALPAAVAAGWYVRGKL